jgi:hypothetical protein
VAFTVARALSPLLLLLGAAAPVPVLAASAVLAGGQASVFNTFHGTTLQTHVPVHLVSRIASVNLLGTLATVPIGLSPAGPLAQATSSRAVLTAGGLLAVLGTLAVLAAPDVRGLTRQPRPEGRTPAPRSP